MLTDSLFFLFLAELKECLVNTDQPLLSLFSIMLAESDVVLLFFMWTEHCAGLCLKNSLLN